MEILKNPVKQLRDSLGMSRHQFARAFDLAYATVAICEYGVSRHIPGSIVAVLREHGIDLQQAENEYQVWREQFRE